jgi:hypothetical protein
MYAYVSTFLIEKSSVIALVRTKMQHWYIEHLLLFNVIFAKSNIHTERGSEFKNKLLDVALDALGIKRSLSMKGCPYDNAVAEATFKITITEFIRKRHFTSLEELTIKF